MISIQSTLSMTMINCNTKSTQNNVDAPFQANAWLAKGWIDISRFHSLTRVRI